MIKKLALISLLAVALFSCKNKQGAVTEIDINKFDDEVSALVDKDVSMTGLVVHVCKHGGKKMFMVGNDQEKKIVVFAGAEMSEFPVELEGKNVKIFGVVKEEVITEETIREWEAEDAKAAEEAAKADSNTSIEVDAKDVKAVDAKVAKEGKVEDVKADTAKKEACAEESGEHKEGSCEEDKYGDLKKQIAESQDGTVKRYWIEVKRFEEVK